MNKKPFIFFIILGCLSLWLTLGTAMALDHTGTLTSDETWSSADNPHYIIGTVTVPAGIELTIEPGVEIFFKGNYSIGVAGSMDAQGTSGSPILFTRDIGITTWYELRFYTGGTGNLAYCAIEYATQGIDLYTNTACTIDHCTIQFCSTGIHYSQAAVNPGHVITNNTLRNNTSYAAYIYNVTDMLIGAGNLIQNNTNGIYFYGCTSPQVASGNTIFRNLNYGVYFGNSSDPVLLSGVSECGAGVIYENCSNIGTVDNLTFSKNAEAAVTVKKSGPFILTWAQSRIPRARSPPPET